jgi:hypothetical protein
MQEARQDAFRYEVVDQVRLPARTYVSFDPDHSPDVAHIDAINQHNRVISILCHGSGHWPDVALRKSGLLSGVVQAAIEGTLVLPAAHQLPDPRTMA